MKVMIRAVIAFWTCTVAVWAASPGVRPRADASSYPTFQAQQDFSIGAAVIPSGLAKRMFKLDMNHAGYVVIEVGVFPAPGKAVDLYPSDFTLYVGDDKIAAMRPVSSGMSMARAGCGCRCRGFVELAVEEN